MQFLYFLESIRNPVLDAIMQFFTELGGEAVFLVLALMIFWCVSKEEGYYLLFVGFLGTIFNQFLKLVFRIPRPWVKDPKFTIVESARADATGYSFPSGHTQNVVGTLGGIARWQKQKWLRIACIATLLLTSFSRMYLGVHTPLDVGVAFAMALILLAALYPAFRTEDAMRRSMPWLIVGALALGSVFLGYVTGLRPDFAPGSEDESNLAHAVKNAWTLLGAVAALLPMYLIERTYIRFDTRAPWYGQILKLVLGLALAVGLKTMLKEPLRTLFPSGFADALRYFILVLYAGCVWPLTFRFFARLGRKAD